MKIDASVGHFCCTVSSKPGLVYWAGEAEYIIVGKEVKKKK